MYLKKSFISLKYKFEKQIVWSSVAISELKMYVNIEDIDVVNIDTY